MARNKLATKEIDLPKGLVVICFEDGSKLTLDAAKLPDLMLDRAKLHGLSQKLGDSYAGNKSVAEAKANVQSVIDQLMAGDWNRGGGGGPQLGILAEALAKLTGKDMDEALAAVTKLSDDERKTLRGNSQIKFAIAEIQTARAKLAADADAEAGKEFLTTLFK